MFLILFLFTHFNFAKEYTIRGMIVNREAGEEMKNATIRVEGTKKGAITNKKGIFLLTLEEGEYVLIAYAVGYENQKRTVNLKKNMLIYIIMFPSEIELNNRPEINVLQLKKLIHVSF